MATALFAGVAVGVAVGIALVSRSGRRRPPPPPPAVTAADLSRRVLEVATSAAVVVDPSDDVVLANPAARRMGVVRGGRLVVADLRRLARDARRAGSRSRSPRTPRRWSSPATSRCCWTT